MVSAGVRSVADWLVVKLLSLSQDDVCVACCRALPRGVTAVWDGVARTTRCVTCAGADVAVLAAAVPRPRAGESARREYARRAERHDQAQAQRSLLSRLLAGSGRQRWHTRVWAQGAAGEEVVGAVLDAMSPQNLIVLHDRRTRDDRGRLGLANIDHIAITPSGVWVVDTKTHQGQLEVRGRGRRDGAQRLYIGGRNQSDLLLGLVKQVASVRRELGNAGLQLPVRGTLCFVGTDLPWRRQAVGDVPLVSPRRLRGLLRQAGAVSAAEQLTASALLDARLPAFVHTWQRG